MAMELGFDYDVDCLKKLQTISPWCSGERCTHDVETNNEKVILCRR
jgi:hypothetical protein